MKATRIYRELLIIGSVLFGVMFINVEGVQAERKVIVSATANIRSGPGTEYEVLWRVEKYFPVIIIQKKGQWCQFKDFENDQGWVHLSLLGNIPGVVVIKDNSNIRSGPGSNFEILFVAERGVPFRELKRKGDWVKVKHVDGDSGWIHHSLLW